MYCFVQDARRRRWNKSSHHPSTRSEEMHQANSMSNLWHTRKWNSSYMGPDWSPGKYTQPQNFHQTLSSIRSYLLYPSITIPTSHPEQRDGWTWRSPRIISIIRKNLHRLLQIWPHQNPWPPQDHPEIDHLNHPFLSYSYCLTTSATSSTSNHWPEDTQDGNTYLEWWPIQLLFVALNSCSKSFDQFSCNSIAKTQLMLQAMPLDKKSAFVQIDSWE